MKLSIADIKANRDLSIYFNWTANALMPVIVGAAYRYFALHRETIVRMANRFLNPVEDCPEIIYRGVIFKTPTTRIEPHPAMKYLSFTTCKEVAEHFASVDGFGSDVINVSQQLGTFGYIIEHKPKPTEILFHFKLLDIFPYMEAFNAMGLNGQKDVDGLKWQREIMIEQPATAFTNLKNIHPCYYASLTQL